MKDGIYTLINAFTVGIIAMGTFGQIQWIWTLALGGVVFSLAVKAWRELEK